VSVLLLKLLSYIILVDKFQGKINIVVGEAYLNDTKANLNIAYSGNLNNGFTDFEVIQNRSLEN
jgi:hypothetical protein